MPKSKQVLKLEPAGELRFKGPYTDVVTSDLRLFNPSDKRVCFKVKTTAPKRYCVRPNSGIIDSGGKVTVAVMLQPFEYDPNEKNKHKFMVQSMFCPKEIESADQLWKEANPEDLMDSKLKCVFDYKLYAEESVGVASRPTGAQDTNVAEKVSLTSSNAPIPELDTDKLLDDNRRLQEETIRLRKLAVDATVLSTPAPTSHVMVEPPGSAVPPYVYLIAAVILGLIIGKFLL